VVSPQRAGGRKSVADELTWIDSPSGAEFGWPSGPPPRFRVGDIEFRCGFGDSGDQLFSIRKDRIRIEEYLEMIGRFENDNFVELGIGSGGSVALTALVAPPRKLVAVDLGADRIGALDELIAERGLGERVRLFYGVDQADPGRLAAIIEEEFGAEPLGLVIDDASHRLEETRASFEALFPRLRPGGLFVIEDWNHQHLVSRALAAALADPSPELKARVERSIGESPPDPPLTRLVVELILIQAESDDFVREVRLDRRWARVYRGSGELDPSGFRLANLITNDFGLLPKE
jgi:SAM-dependent methyltransferase